MVILMNNSVDVRSRNRRRRVHMRYKPDRWHLRIIRKIARNHCINNAFLANANLRRPKFFQLLLQKPGQHQLLLRARPFPRILSGLRVNLDVTQKAGHCRFGGWLCLAKTKR